MSQAVIVLCCRVQSSRLPGKALLPLGGIPVARQCLIRLAASGFPTILAVPPGDEVHFKGLWEDIAGVEIYVGEAQSPLHRTWNAVKERYPSADYIVRATHDDPFVDTESVKEVVAYAREGELGYAVLRGMVDGGGVEAISRENFHWAAQNYTEPCEFISYAVRGPGVPNQKQFNGWAKVSLQKPHRLTLDYPEDYLVMEAAMRAVGSDATIEQICAYLDQTPWLAELNLMPDVSFYTCVKNGGSWLEKLCANLRGVTSRRWEHIIWDDGSTDDTMTKALREVARYRERVRFNQNLRNVGLATSSNLAVKTSRGRYVLRVDADDLVNGGAVDKMIQKADDENLDIVYSNYQEFTEGEDIRNNPVVVNQGQHAGCALMRRSFLAEAKFKNGIMVGDSAELRERTKAWAKVGFIREPLWRYRKHENSLTAKKARETRSHGGPSSPSADTSGGEVKTGAGQFQGG